MKAHGDEQGHRLLSSIALHFFLLQNNTIKHTHTPQDTAGRPSESPRKIIKVALHLLHHERLSKVSVISLFSTLLRNPSDMRAEFIGPTGARFYCLMPPALSLCFTFPEHLLTCHRVFGSPDLLIYLSLYSCIPVSQ